MPEQIDLLEAQATHTRRIILSTGDDVLDKPSTGCPGWTVKQVIAHLTTGAQMFEEIARGTLDGAAWMTVRTQRNTENAALPAAELKRRYEEADRSLVDTFKSLSPEELQAKRQHPALGEVPVAQFLGMRISETAVHGWDVQSAFDSNARLDAPVAGTVAAVLASAFPAWFLPDAIAGMTRTYRFVVDGGEHTMAIAGGKASWTDGGQPDATLTLSTGDFLLLMSGRVSSEQLIASGRARAAGDVQAAKQLSTLFKAYAGR